jgi:hypothetical protein
LHRKQEHYYCWDEEEETGKIEMPDLLRKWKPRQRVISGPKEEHNYSSRDGTKWKVDVKAPTP